MSNEIMQENIPFVECSAFHRGMSVLEASLRNTEDSEAIISGLLKGAAEFYGASRASVVEADWDLGIGVITYEWCKDGVPAQRDMLQCLPMEKFPRWRKALRANKPVVISDLQRLEKVYPDEAAFFREYGVTTLLAAPFSKRINQGFIAVDDPTRYTDDPVFLFIASYAVVVELNEIKQQQSLLAATKASKYNPEDIHINFFGGMEIISSKGTEMHGNLKTASGPSIEKSGDLAAILTTLEPGDVLFIDEIHRLPKQVEEVLYPAMEDYCLDIVVGKDSATVHNIRINLPPFTLVGATTRAGDLSAPLRDRFGIISQLEYYNLQDLEKIVYRTSCVMNTEIDKNAVTEIALRSRGTPRIANRLFRRVRDFAQVYNEGVISSEIAKTALDRLRVDHLGLDTVDHKYLKGIIERFKGGPVGLEAIASSIGEEPMTLEDVYEPYLLQIGFINRTPRGRIVTPKAYEHLQIPYQKELFTD